MTGLLFVRETCNAIDYREFQSHSADKHVEVMVENQITIE